MFQGYEGADVCFMIKYPEISNYKLNVSKIVLNIFPDSEEIQSGSTTPGTYVYTIPYVGRCACTISHQKLFKSRR